MTEETVKSQGEWSFYNLAPHAEEKDIAILREIERASDDDLSKQLLEGLMRNGVVLRVSHQHNIVPTSGRTILARNLAGTVSPTPAINYIALGTGTTAFSNASVQLNAETFRKVVSDSSYDTNISYIDCFIASGDVANQTFKEAGAFINGTASANTGTAFSLVVQDFAKSGSMYISLKVTFT